MDEGPPPPPPPPPPHGVPPQSMPQPIPQQEIQPQGMQQSMHQHGFVGFGIDPNWGIHPPPQQMHAHGAPG